MDADEINELIMCACVLHNVCIEGNDPNPKDQDDYLSTHMLTLKQWRSLASRAKKVHIHSLDSINAFVSPVPFPLKESAEKVEQTF